MLRAYWIAGKEAKLPGQACGAGLTSEAADALGLKAGLPVAVSIIDAHAGALGNNDFVCFLRVTISAVADEHTVLYVG